MFDTYEVEWVDVVRLLEENLKYLNQQEISVDDKEKEKLKEEFRQVVQSIKDKHDRE